MIFGIGTDIVSVERIQKAIDKNPRFFQRVFSEKEQSYLQQTTNYYASAAGHFAAKEALAKALGIGLWELGLQGAEVIHNKKGRPEMVIKKDALMAQPFKIHLSISHERLWAVAVVILEASNHVFTDQ